MNSFDKEIIEMQAQITTKYSKLVKRLISVHTLDILVKIISQVLSPHFNNCHPPAPSQDNMEFNEMGLGKSKRHLEKPTFVLECCQIANRYLRGQRR